MELMDTRLLSFLYWALQIITQTQSLLIGQRSPSSLFSGTISCPIILEQMSCILKEEEQVNQFFTRMSVFAIPFLYTAFPIHWRVFSVWHTHPNSLAPPGSVHPLPATDVAPGRCDSQRRGQFRRSGHSPARAVRLDASMGVCAPFCKFLEEALGYVEKCFVVEERVVQQQNGGPRLVVSKAVMEDASVLHVGKVSEGEGE